jgi:hypothetical protein
MFLTKQRENYSTSCSLLQMSAAETNPNEAT